MQAGNLFWWFDKRQHLALLSWIDFILVLFALSGCLASQKPCMWLLMNV